jgi:N-acetylglucosamine kinase-like BadF-type ATPase
MTAIMGVDVGGSGIRAATRVDGVERRHAVDRAVHLGSSIDSAALAEAIVGLIAAPASATEVICIGMTGFPGLVDDPENVARPVMDATGARAVLVASDSVTTHVGALDMAPGVVVAAGTGVIALGTDHRSRWNRVDGWGHLFGDEGSGAWVGRAALTAAIRAHDGRGGSPALLDGLRSVYGDVSALLHAVYDAGAPAYQLARFAPAVAAAAHAGDEVAASIWRNAAQHLADTAIAASRGLAPVFSWGGGLFAERRLLLEPFQNAIREQEPAAEFREPVGGSLEGALRLAERFASTGTLELNETYVRVYER